MSAVIREIVVELWSLLQKRPRLRAVLGVVLVVAAIQILVLAYQLLTTVRTADLYTISGRVSLDGQPPNSGFVSFFPKQGRASVGVIQSDGRYSLVAAAGEYAVVIEVKELLFNGRHESEFSEEERRAFPASATEVRWLVPERYLAQSTTPLTVTVSGRRSNVDFVVTK